jgi:hypothetical protein
MSLKAFHVLFITLSIVLTVFFGMWAFSMRHAVVGVVSFISGAGLAAYEVRFIRKIAKFT